MTYQQFIQRLTETPRDWKLIDGQYVRRIGACGPMCPISALEDEPTHLWVTVAEHVGLPQHLALDIVTAADSTLRNTTTRREVLAACGL